MKLYNWQPLKHWAYISNIKIGNLRYRLNKWMTIEEAMGIYKKESYKWIEQLIEELPIKNRDGNPIKTSYGKLLMLIECFKTKEKRDNFWQL